MSVCLPPESIPGMPQIVRDRLREGIETIAEDQIFADYARTRGTGAESTIFPGKFGCRGCPSVRYPLW